MSEVLSKLFCTKLPGFGKNILRAGKSANEPLRGETGNLSGCSVTFIVNASSLPSKWAIKNTITALPAPVCRMSDGQVNCQKAEPARLSL